MAPDDQVTRKPAEDRENPDDQKPYRADCDGAENANPKGDGKGSADRASGDNKGPDGGKDDTDKPNIFQNRLVRIGAVIVLVLLVVGGVIWWLISRHYESTDDAYIDTHLVFIAPQISGEVTKIHVTDNQLVQAGDPLVDIDTSDADARIAQVRAQKVLAVAQRAQAISSERSAAAQVENAEHDLLRYLGLHRATPDAVSQQQIDQAEAAAKSARAQRDAAEDQIAGAAAQIDVYQTQIDAANLNHSYTHIVAPISGHVAQRSVAIGNYVTPGQQLLALVPLEVWVTANFKETQLTHVRVGQPVSLTIDACGKRKIKAHVESIQRGAGQAFGILPPENATGNYVKVVQRVPVKITFDEAPTDCPLGPGMSVEPTITVR